jgi:mannitol-1-phosphate 5-dehydrogenase
MEKRTLVGFGFGPIQAGLFAYEARRSGRFGRIVVVEIDDALVQAIRRNGNSYAVNIAGKDGINVETVPDVELLNPARSDARRQIVEALSQATDVATALPSVEFFDRGAPSVASLLAKGLMAPAAKGTLVYACENHNRAAEILEHAVRKGAPSLGRPVQFLNTVIGKMSQVVRGSDVHDVGLKPIAPGLDRACLVESFNHILVTRTSLQGFGPGIECFEEKDDLLPFEEAKLYGHNAVHALLGYLLESAGAGVMADAASKPGLMKVARKAFLDESGAALRRKYRGLDALFTEDGWRIYAEDLLERMVNPYLRDAVVRVTRDPERKLGWDDRLIGTMRLVWAQGIEPACFALGAHYALRKLASEKGVSPDNLLQTLWLEQDAQERQAVVSLVRVVPENTVDTDGCRW